MNELHLRRKRCQNDQNYWIYAERGAKIYGKMMRCRFLQNSQKFFISCKIKRTEEALCPER